MAADFYEALVDENEDENSAVYLKLSSTYDELGDYESSLDAINKYIKAYPKYDLGYIQRAWINSYAGKISDAIEDYDMAIALSPDDSYSYLHRGILYRSIGKAAKANSDFNKVLSLNKNTPEPGNLIMASYASYYLGEKSDAKGYLRKVINEHNVDDYYNIACLYSLLNEPQNALSYFESALENGHRNFFHIERDTDLENIRSYSKYSNLIRDYKSKMNQELDELEKRFYQKLPNDLFEDNYVEKTQEIPYKKVGGVYQIPCSINGLPLNFIFDTGAADITISSVEAAFMLKNGYLSKNDVLGSLNYQTANGDIVEGTVFKLKEIKIGDAVFKNVRAAVVHNQSAPLLLGQSALGQFGKIEIDNNNRVLRISWKEKKQ